MVPSLSLQNNITPLHVASKWGRVNMVNTLLDRGARIDAKTRVSIAVHYCTIIISTLIQNICSAVNELYQRTTKVAVLIPMSWILE